MFNGTVIGRLSGGEQLAGDRVAPRLRILLPDPPGGPGVAAPVVGPRCLSTNWHQLAPARRAGGRPALAAVLNTLYLIVNTTRRTSALLLVRAEVAMSACGDGVCW
jgi:hypothetical protein